MFNEEKALIKRKQFIFQQYFYNKFLCDSELKGTLGISCKRDKTESIPIPQANCLKTLYTKILDCAPVDIPMGRTNFRQQASTKGNPDS